MYYLYHIKGVKIGCSTEPAKRVKRQGYTEYDILETHTDIDVASVREKELQKEYGYKVDNTDYKQSKTISTIGGISVHKKHPNLAYKWGKNTPNSVREKRRKPVLQFDLNGNFIAEYPFQIWVKHNLGISISNCLKGRTKTAGGYIWKFKS